MSMNLNNEQVINEPVVDQQVEEQQEHPVVRENFQEDVSAIAQEEQSSEQQQEEETVVEQETTDEPVQNNDEEVVEEEKESVENNDETVENNNDVVENNDETVEETVEEESAPVADQEESKPVVEETTSAPQEDLEEEQQKADEAFDDLFAEDSQEEIAEEDGPVGEKATGSDEKPKTADSAAKDLYDPNVAQAAKEKAARHAINADGQKTTAIVEQSNALEHAGDEVGMDDLAWLNEEDDADDMDINMDDLFPNMDEELALEDGTTSGNLALGDVPGADEQKEEIKMNAFEEGLDRLKRKRPATEMTPQEAEDKMEDLICKMSTAADEDCEIMRKNMAKERLAQMCVKAAAAHKKNQGYLSKREHNQRFQKLYKFAVFPDGKAALRSYFDGEADNSDKAIFNTAKALSNTKKLLKEYPSEPALAKVSILKHCITEINKPSQSEWFVTFGGLSVVRSWLEPNPDGSLPALSLRTELLRVLAKLPVTTSNLKKSKLGITLKQLVQNEDENLVNRKACQELINKWLSLVLDQETSIRRNRAQVQHEQAEVAKPVTKKRKTKEQIREENKEIQARRHPQMFQKPSHNFVVQPSYEVHSVAEADARARQTRKGKIAKRAGELRALRPSEKHEHVSIAGGKINLTFGN